MSRQKTGTKQKKRRERGPLTVAKNRIVCVMHEIRDYYTDKLIEQTHDGREEAIDNEGNVILFGRDNADPAYEALLLGLHKGQEKEAEITFSPPDPAGEWDADRSKFPAEGMPGAPIQGEVMHLEDEEGPIFPRVVYCDPFTLRLSTNLPYAGKRCRIWLKVLKVRTAYRDEIARGIPACYMEVLEGVPVPR